MAATSDFSVRSFPSQTTQNWTVDALEKMDYQCFTPLSEEAEKVCQQMLQTVAAIKIFITKIAGTAINQDRLPYFIQFSEKVYYYKEIGFNSAEWLAYKYTYALMDHLNKDSMEAIELRESIADAVAIGYMRLVLKCTATCIHIMGDTSLPSGKSISDNIFSRGFYLASKFLQHDSTKLEQLLKLWFQAVQSLGKEEQTFLVFSQKTMTIAKKDYEKLIYDAVFSAWQPPEEKKESKRRSTSSPPESAPSSSITFIKKHQEQIKWLAVAATALFVFYCILKKFYRGTP